MLLTFPMISQGRVSNMHEKSNDLPLAAKKSPAWALSRYQLLNGLGRKQGVYKVCLIRGIDSFGFPLSPPFRHVDSSFRLLHSGAEGGYQREPRLLAGAELLNGYVVFFPPNL